jgi:hypothetical protein
MRPFEIHLVEIDLPTHVPQRSNVDPGWCRWIRK